MARLTGPLFSLGASGTIADTLTFANWKGIPYVRTRVIPANPKKTAQRRVRGVFITLNELWKRMPTDGRAPFVAAALGQPFTDRNKHIGENVVPLRDDADLSNYVWSVSGGQAIPPADFATTPAALNINVKLDVPTYPAGYSFAARVAAAIESGDPSVDGGMVRRMYVMRWPVEAANFNIIVGVAGTYNTGGWMELVRDSDGKTFYSAALRATVTL